MSGDRPVLVVGAGGNVGGAVVAAAGVLGVPVRAAGRDPAALAERLPGVPTVHLDLGDRATFAPALEGAGALFLVRPPAVARVGPTLNALVDVARAQGVEHVVFSSVTGADTNPVVPHHRVETHLHTCGLPWTVLRPGFFAQNLADAYRRDVVEGDRVVLPAGDARVAFVDTRDVGAVAAHVLADPVPHRGAAYVLTGPQAVTFEEVAAVLTRELGRRITYHPVGVPTYARHVRRQGLPLAQVLVQTVLHAGLRRGQAERVDPTLEELLGRPGRTVEEYVRDNRSTWVSTGTRT